MIDKRIKDMFNLMSSKDIVITNEEVIKLITFGDYMLEYNKKVNLTAIKQWDDVVNKHFIDSIFPLVLLEFPFGAKVIDVGTGAGFPSIPMKIYREDLDFTLIESIGKKTKYLESALNHIGLNCTVVNERAENYAHAHREEFDIAIARAVASFNVLCEYLLPFVKVGGFMAAMKSASEPIKAFDGLKMLGGEMSEVCEYYLPAGDKRRVIIVKKISQGDTKYPRNSAAITKKPL